MATSFSLPSLSLVSPPSVLLPHFLLYGISVGECSSSDSATEGSESGPPKGGKDPSNGTWDTLDRFGTSAIPAIPVTDPLLSRSATGGTRAGVWWEGTVGGRPLGMGAGTGTEERAAVEAEVEVGDGICGACGVGTEAGEGEMIGAEAAAKVCTAAGKAGTNAVAVDGWVEGMGCADTADADAEDG